MVDRMEIPEPRYAKAADGVSLAYQVFGHGRHDIVWLPGNATQLDLAWDYRPSAAFMLGLAELGRVILVDRRGVGLSDRVPPDDLPPVEVTVSDLITVLDTVGSRDTAAFGCDEGAHAGVLLAATHPERVRALVLFAPRPSMVATPEHPWGGSREEWEEWLEWASVNWGSRESIVHDLHELAPSLLLDEEAIRWGARVQRSAASPSAAVALFRISMQLNVADVLPTVRTPTLIVHRRDDVLVPIEAGRAVADLMPDATFVELPGQEHFASFGPTTELLDAIGSFLASGTSIVADRSRRLATILFTDIVSSTERAAALGDATWTGVLKAHHVAVRRELQRHGGSEIDTAGDGFFALFVGPAAGVRCAKAIVKAVRALGLEVRVGVHTGEVEIVEGTVTGIGVVIGARIGGLAAASEVLVSSTVKDLTAGSGLVFEDAGEHPLKGVPDPWHVYRAG
jgi:pimeloyl-ACP methyl ester carboxylesterase